MKNLYLLFLLLGLLVVESEAAISEVPDIGKPEVVRLINIEKSAPSQGVTIHTSADSDKVIFRFDLKKWGKGTLRVSDARGQLLLEKPIKDWTIGINLHDAAPGFYTVTLEKEELLEIIEIRKE